jgi:Flp pilus assembly pilin Flp
MKTAIRKKGQTMTETVIITAIIAIVSILVVTNFGDLIREKFEDMTGIFRDDVPTQPAQPDKP